MTANSTTSAPRLRPLIFGEVLFDHFPDGTSVLGGAPFNVAWHLQAFGQQPLLLSCVGKGALGEQLQAAMQAWGMDQSGLQLDPHHPTGVVDVQFHDGEPQYEIVPDSAWDFIRQEHLPALPANALLYHGSLALRQPVSHATWEYLSQQPELPRFIDINLRAPWWDAPSIAPLLRHATYLKLNADELATLIPQAADTEAQIQQLFTDSALQYLILTQGAAGAMAIAARGERWHVAPEHTTHVVDTVGAGDAFSSVVLLGLLNGWGMAQTVQRAQQFASAVVGLRGATTRSMAFYQPFIDAWQLTF
ncbi:PfkB family carbohydrate kinase [Candidatus Thiothrix anitrata]|uniref:Carbohydrate kinase n=1 Tax=Candidatus Thiothrix anitrata TaxID=2823902 RepID=A0ABX7X3P0_9GAMM|nr:PfkB family carbohydrate kinase [Candidatus Thiothrix anitrata]QTR50421.1 carbohydrate kinase [Candidatus Thiothrix anitrata]